MTRSSKLLALTIAAAWLAGCSDGGITDVSWAERTEQAGVGSLKANAGPTPDLGGSWNWSSEEHLTFPAWVAATVFGFTPSEIEGPIMSARCENAGTMTLVQADGTFTGVLTRTMHQCVTKGGQPFQDPGAFGSVAIADGQIRGRSVHFLRAGVMLDCPRYGVISEVEGGVAIAMKGTGRCIVPGHPKSRVPLDPPPAGTSKALSWHAVRP
jgi:hypothetical protein